MADTATTEKPEATEKPDPPEKPKGEHEGGEDGEDTTGKVRREAQGLRDRLKAAEEELEGLRSEKQTELERNEARAKSAEEKVDSLTKRLRSASLKATVAELAADLGIHNAKAARRLMDDEPVRYDDSGEADPKTVEKALKDAIKEYPFLTRSGDADTGSGEDEPVDAKGAMNEWLRGNKDKTAA